MPTFALEMRGIVKRFPGLVALNRVDFNLERGEVHALLGINGAGKSTLIKILSGVYAKDEGDIVINGSAVDIADPLTAKRHGVATVYQHPQMIPSFTGYENIFLGDETKSGGLFPRIRRGALRARARELLKSFPVEVDLDLPVYELSAVERECVAILRALAQSDISILILDEPTSILTRKESEVLFDVIRGLKSKGIAIVYITHRLDEVFEIADRFTIFRNGENVGTFATAGGGVTNADIAEKMLGDKLERLYPEKEPSPREVVLSLSGLGKAGAYSGITLEARRGEILGIFGLVGSGIDELAKTIYGMARADAGEMRLHGRPHAPRSGAAGLAAGVFIVPGDRAREGYFGAETVAFNMTLANLGRISSAGFTSRLRERRDAAKMIDEFDVRPRDAAAAVGGLSGGNQQKVVMAKAAYADAELCVFCEPTVGVDVGAKAGIYKHIRAMAKAGKCAVVVGSDCEEIHGVADRVAVLYQGRLVMDKPAAEAGLDEILLRGLTGGETK